MTGPTSSISKKKTKSKPKLSPSFASASEELEVSPVSVKGTDAKQILGVHKKTLSESQGARRRLNLDNINLSALTGNSVQVSSLGCLTRTTKEFLKNKSSGKADTILHVSPIRLPGSWEKFQFFLFADHTGIASCGAPVEVFKVLEPFSNSSASAIPAVIIEGAVHFELSTKTEGEVYMTIRDGSAVVKLTQASAHPQTFSTFHTIRNIISNPYYATATFSRLIGDCVTVQKQEGGNRHSYMLQDSTGFAVIHVQKENDASEAEGLATGQNKDSGPMIFEGAFKFETVETNGLQAISSTLNTGSVHIKHAYPFIERHIMLVKNTKSEDYQFEFDSEFDIRSVS